MVLVRKDTATSGLGWWIGGAVLVGLGFTLHRLLDFDVDFDLDWENLPA